ncbi:MULTISPECIES: NADPH-dependent FMN reductase [Pseudonocardia]|uniref:NADPH azoreductase n=2 Tax=Pseudonocardia TaxID=1847 RepID=A0A1Y2MGS1_PSEAH|nr:MULTISPECIES: NAD(P)H-dependent oxidoreductase [Pseudonocardia]OSY34484.1 NADPH azoreductase [Pseudonocardia autotrophica]TDN75505.1 NAD(P)H-dependent FMN reductase [Pseudonocardia autotrophica]BBF99473.1 FMN reductase [Pseudonocardia autotrophica]GEC29670.1 FMN reductase [Pseudonocardia saturnea]
MTLQHPIRLAVIVGSTRRGRFAPTVADWVAEQVRARGDIKVDVIDLAETALPEVLGDEHEPIPAPVTKLAPRLAAADAFVVVTPEYNHSFPAALKTAIDWFFDEWTAKPVGFVSYGGMGGGLRAVEALRLVFAELHATTVRDVVSFHFRDWPFQFEPVDPGAVKALSAQLDQLGWWAAALRTGRERVPYASVT